MAGDRDEGEGSMGEGGERGWWGCRGELRGKGGSGRGIGGWRLQWTEKGGMEAIGKERGLPRCWQLHDAGQGLGRAG